MTDDQLEEKIDNGRFAVDVQIFTAFLILGWYFFVKQMTKDLKEEYDEASTTPSDYTLYFYIEPDIQEYFD